MSEPCLGCCALFSVWCVCPSRATVETVRLAHIRLCCLHPPAQRKPFAVKLSFDAASGRLSWRGGRAMDGAEAGPRSIAVGDMAMVQVQWTPLTHEAIAVGGLANQDTAATAPHWRPYVRMPCDAAPVAQVGNAHEGFGRVPEGEDCCVT